MPSIAIYKDSLISVADIYKHAINKDDVFECYHCMNPLQLKQSRHGDTQYTEHFFHPNTQKGTSIDCEQYKIQDFRNQGPWHIMMSELLLSGTREIRRYNGSHKHILDGYDPVSKLGIEFQNSSISVKDVESRESLTEIDWIFNVSEQYVSKVEIGLPKMAVVEIPHDSWRKAVKVCKNNVFLYTGKTEWIWLTDTTSYRVSVGGHIRHVWIGEHCSFKDVIENTCLEAILSEEGKLHIESITRESLPSETIVYARCKESMHLFDDIYRYHVQHMKFAKNSVTAIKSVAGSGKTTTLLELARKHSTKRILYVAFNRSLIEEIRSKLKKQGISNMFPRTFDSLIHMLYSDKFRTRPDIVDMKPYSIGQYMPWFQNKPFYVKKKYSNLITRFCRNADYDSLEEFMLQECKKEEPLLKSIWNKFTSDDVSTFDTRRKQTQINHWCKDFIDKKYDMIFIDEAQDFDPIMLKILLEDTTIPKVFVGDPKQAIYQWRGSINAFERLPPHTTMIEFYSTFRIGDPACEDIRSRCTNCWMISKSKNETKLVAQFPNEPACFVFLFRGWRSLLQTAQHRNNVWIYQMEDKIVQIRRLYEQVQKYPLSEDEKDQYEDDLPNFLLTLGERELGELLDSVSRNSVKKEDATCHMYTVHSYKGLEHDYVRVANDVEPSEENLYYVALTRGMKYIAY